MSAEPPVTAEAAPKPAAPGKLAAVLDTSNIGRRIDIFERQVGPPDDAGDDWTSYTVEKCGVHVTTEGGTVGWIQLYLLEGCQVDLAPLMGTPRMVSQEQPLAFGEFDKLASGHTNYTYPCPGIDCGNAMEGYVMVVVPGAHVNNFIDVEARSSLGGEKDYDVFFDWKEKVKAASGQEYFDGNLDCDRQFDEIGRTVLAGLQVDSIGFGHRQGLFACK